MSWIYAAVYLVFAPSALKGVSVGTGVLTCNIPSALAAKLTDNETSHIYFELERLC